MPASSILDSQELPDPWQRHPIISFSACEVFSCPQDGGQEFLGNPVLLHPHNMTQVLQPPLLYLRNKFEVPIEFVELVIRPNEPLLLLKDCIKHHPLSHSKPVLVAL
jgi:hypothetical protein